MPIDFCIPVYRNTKTFASVIKGIVNYQTNIGRVLLHVQDDTDLLFVNNVMNKTSLDWLVIPTVKTHEATMADRMNALLSASTACWVVMTEQDCFLRRDLGPHLMDLHTEGYIMSGPLDIVYHNHPVARRMPKYGTITRMCSLPGYFHSALVCLKRHEIIGQCATPFTTPKDFVYHGYGVLGGEPYYGLRVNCGHDASKLMIYNQAAAPYGYGVDITTHEGIPLATHLYYSGTKHAYRERGNVIDEREFEWLESEENRFLADYDKMIESQLD